MTRRESRELAFILVFEKSFQGDDVTIIELIENALELEIFPTNAFAENLARKVYDNLQEVDSAINENLVGWSAKRISRVSRAILRVAVAELLYSDIPVGVAINEAIEKKDLGALMQYYEKLSEKEKDDIRNYLLSINDSNDVKAAFELLLNL